MKLICTFFLLVILQTAYGQTNKKAKTPDAPAAPAPINYCDQVKKDVSDDKTAFDFSSPYDQYENHPMRITRSFSNNPEFSYDNFFIIFEYAGDLDSIYDTDEKGIRKEKNESKVIIEFDDHSKIVDDTMKINHDFTLDKSQSIRFVYYPVNDNNYNSFINKKVLKFSLGGYEQVMPVDSTDSFRKYLACIKAAKK